MKANLRIVFLFMLLGGLVISQRNKLRPAVESISVSAPGKRVELTPSKWVPQTYNNCGPAAVSMALQHFGVNVSQAEMRKKLRTNPTDANVFSQEISDYLRNSHGLESRVMINGDLTLLKKLLANGVYVIVQIWLHPYEDIGHNTVIRGYDDMLGVLIADDPYVGVGVKYKYTDFDAGQWKVFNREYIPIYTKDKEQTVKAILGDSWEKVTMYKNSLGINSEAAIKNPKDMYSWFNLGASYFALGDFTRAKEAFEKSRAIGWPRRMLWYQYQPVQTYNALREYSMALELTKIGLRNNPSYAEMHYEAAVAYKGLGNREKAKVEAETAVKLAPGFKPAIDLLKNI